MDWVACLKEGKDQKLLKVRIHKYMKGKPEQTNPGNSN